MVSPIAMPGASDGARATSISSRLRSSRTICISSLIDIAKARSFWACLLRNSRKTECGAILFLIRLTVAPHPLRSIARLITGRSTAVSRNRDAESMKTFLPSSTRFRPLGDHGHTRLVRHGARSGGRRSPVQLQPTNRRCPVLSGANEQGNLVSQLLTPCICGSL